MAITTYTYNGLGGMEGIFYDNSAELTSEELAAEQARWRDRIARKLADTPAAAFLQHHEGDASNHITTFIFDGRGWPKYVRGAESARPDELNREGPSGK